MRTPDENRPESNYEKLAMLPESGDNDPGRPAWVDTPPPERGELKFVRRQRRRGDEAVH